MGLLLLMLLVMPYENSPYLYLGTNLFGIFPDFTVIKLLGLVGFVWAMLRLTSGDPMTRRLSTRPVALFLLLFAWVALVGLVHGTGFQYAISKYLGFLLFLPFVLTAVRSQTDLRRVLAVVVLSYALLFPYAVRQMLRFGDRLGVGLYEANYLATTLVLLIPVALTLAAQQRDSTRRKLWLGAGLLLVLMVFLTSSRGGFVGLLVAGVVFVYRRRGLAAAAVLVVALIASVVMLPTDLGTRAMATIFQDSSQLPPGLEASNRAHVALFWAALGMIGDNPLFGVGQLNFKDMSTRYGLDHGHIGHNSFLEIAAELGLPALAVFVLLLAATFRTLGRVARLRGGPQVRELAGWAEGLRSGLLGFLVAGCFISAQYEKILWVTIFLTIALGDIARRRLALEAADVVEPEPRTLAPAPSTS
jgi:O-antigen ligase